MSEKVEKKKGKKEKEEKKTTDTRKTLLITGGNRGLGYAIIENLLEKKTKLKLIITSRNEEQGQEIYNSLCEKYPEEKEKVERIVLEEMQGAFALAVPLVADSGFGQNWLEAH